jgi:hypothetical protein
MNAGGNHEWLPVTCQIITEVNRFTHILLFGFERPGSPGFLLFFTNRKAWLAEEFGFAFFRLARQARSGARGVPPGTLSVTRRSQRRQREKGGTD